MNERSHPRSSRHLQVRFRPEGDDHVYAGFTTNISRSGMFIKTNFPVPPGTRLRVEVDQPGQSFAVEGIVVHAAKVSPELARIRASGMGVRFVPVEELMGAIIDPGGGEEEEEAGAAGRSRADEAPATGVGAQGTDRRARRERRGPGGDRPAYVVRFADADEFLDALRRDISEGGLFVPSPSPARLDSEIRVQLLLPPPIERTVELPARVVLRIEPAGDGRTAGMGVAFSRPEAALEELRRHARHLAEARTDA